MDKPFWEKSKSKRKKVQRIFNTRISGRYAPFILAPAEGLPSHACKGSLRSLTYTIKKRLLCSPPLRFQKG